MKLIKERVLGKEVLLLCLSDASVAGAEGRAPCRSHNLRAGAVCVYQGAELLVCSFFIISALAMGPVYSIVWFEMSAPHPLKTG